MKKLILLSLIVFQVSAFAAPASSTSSVSSSSSSAAAAHSEHWGPNPQGFKYSLGYERALNMAAPGANSTSTTNGEIGSFAFDNLVLGYWASSAIGFDVNLGFNNPADSFTTTTATTGAAGAQTEVTTHSGSKTAMNVLLGTTLKYRVFQNEWFQAYGGWMLGLSPGNSSEAATGTSTKNVAASTTVDTNVGTVKTERSVIFTTGPKLGAQFYPKWFPHLALGFATGIAFQFGGKTTTTTATQNKAADGTVSNQSSTVAVVDNGSQTATFGIGGQQFSLLGAFNLRYEF